MIVAFPRLVARIRRLDRRSERLQSNAGNKTAFLPEHLFPDSNYDYVGRRRGRLRSSCKPVAATLSLPAIAKPGVDREDVSLRGTTLAHLFDEVLASPANGMHKHNR